MYKDPIAGGGGAAAGGGGSSGQRAKRLKNVYLVNKRKFYSPATPEEMLMKLDLGSMPDGYVEEDIHRILQARIR